MLETVCYSTMDKDLLTYKINKVAAKIKAYYTETQPQTVDIPEFMKPFNQQINDFVQSHINRILQEGSLDYWYFKLLEEEDNGVRR